MRLNSGPRVGRPNGGSGWVAVPGRARVSSHGRSDPSNLYMLMSFRVCRVIR